MSGDAFARLSGMPPAYFDEIEAKFPGSDESALRVFLALRAAARRIDNAVSQWLEAHDLTLTRMDILHLVASSDGGTTVSRLSEHLHMTQPNVTFVVSGLERDGLIRRAADKGDRRASIVTLTTAGRRLIAKITATQLQSIKAGVASLPVAKRDAFVTTLAEITEGFERAPLPS